MIGPITGLTTNTVDVKLKFNAIGNGTTDDTAAINLAIAYTNTNGGTLYFPRGTYKITATLTSLIGPLVNGKYGNLSFVGDGAGVSILKYTGTGAMIQVYDGSHDALHPASNIYFRGLTLWGPSPSLIANGPNATGAYDASTVGIDYMTQFAGGYGIYDCEFMGWGLAAIRADDVTNMLILGINAHHNKLGIACGYKCDKWTVKGALNSNDMAADVGYYDARYRSSSPASSVQDWDVIMDTNRIGLILGGNASNHIVASSSYTDSTTPFMIGHSSAEFSGNQLETSAISSVNVEQVHTDGALQIKIFKQVSLFGIYISDATIVSQNASGDLTVFDNPLGASITLSDASTPYATAAAKIFRRNSANTANEFGILPIASLNVYVSATNGTDTRTYAATNKYNTPFLTLAAAQTAAASGDTIIVQDGTFNEKNLFGKTGVNWIFMPSATIAVTGAVDGDAIFNDGGAGITVLVSGFGQTFTITGSTNSTSVNGVRAQAGGGYALTVRGINLSVTNTATTGGVANGILTSSSTGTTTINYTGNITATGGASATSLGVSNSKGTITVNGNVTCAGTGASSIADGVGNTGASAITTVNGNVQATGGSSGNGVGALINGGTGSSLTVNGNMNGTGAVTGYGVNISGNGSALTVNGNLSASGAASNTGNPIFSSSGNVVVTVTGTVTLSSGTVGAAISVAGTSAVLRIGAFTDGDAQSTVNNGLTLLDPSFVAQTSTPTTGNTVTFAKGPQDTNLYVTPAGTLAALTIALPGETQTRIGQVLNITCSQIITALTVNGATTIYNAPASLSAGQSFQVTKLAANVWAVTSTKLTAAITGTTTNDNATAGNIGEYVSASVVQGSATALTTATPKTVTSISLTAGDWDVTGIASLTGASTGTEFDVAVGTTTNSFTGTVLGDTRAQTPTVSLTGADATLMIPAARMSLSGTTTVYLIVQETFTVGTPSAYGRISARRCR